MFNSDNMLNTGLEEAASDLLLSAYAAENEALRFRLGEQLKARGEKQVLLAQRARDSREKTGDNFLVVRASIEFSNYCRQICGYCGMAATNTVLERYRLNSKQMCKIVKEISSLGVTDLHLASGEDPSFKASALVPVIAEAVSAGMDVTLVNGQRSIDDYALWKDAGASRYIIKVETTNPVLFKQAKPGVDLIQRVSHLLYLRGLGYKIGSGVISGLPEQTVGDLAGDLVFLKKLNPDMSSVSRFLPNSQSRYAQAPEGDPDTALNFLSLLRVELSRPGLRIPAGTSLGHRQIDAFDHGANVVSLHMTPSEYADLYSSYRAENRISTRMEKIQRFARETGMPLQLSL